MKKISSIVLCFFVIAGAAFVSACKTTHDLTQTINTKIEAFINDEQNSFLVVENQDISYSVEIESQIENSQVYGQLDTLYFNVLKNLMLMFNLRYVNLQINPFVHDSKTEKLYEEFDSQLTMLQNATAKFKTEKTNFELRANANFESQATLQELRKFKQQYTTLIKQAVLFNESFEKLYTYSYMSVPTNTISVYQNGLEDLVTIVTINKITRAYVAYLIDNESNLLIDDSNFNAMSLINQLKTALENPNYKANKLELLNNLTVYTIAFDTEINQYIKSIENVDTKLLKQNGEQVYLQSHAEQAPYVEKIINFNDIIASNYTNKVLELIG